MDKRNIILIIGITFVIGCIICGLSYFMIPLFASLINGRPIVLSFILAAFIAIIAVFSMVLIKKKAVNIPLAILTLATGATIILCQGIRFDFSYYRYGYIHPYYDRVYNKYGIEILPWGDWRLGELDGYGKVWYKRSYDNSRVTIYSLDGEYITTESGEYIMDEIGLHPL